MTTETPTPTTPKATPKATPIPATGVIHAVREKRPRTKRAKPLTADMSARAAQSAATTAGNARLTALFNQLNEAKLPVNARGIVADTLRLGAVNARKLIHARIDALIDATEKAGRELRTIPSKSNVKVERKRGTGDSATTEIVPNVTGTRMLEAFSGFSSLIVGGRIVS